MWSPLASASVVFLVLYFCLFSFICALLALRKVPWKSRWLLLLFHVLFRLVSQACGLAFGVVGYSNIDVLIAYYVFGAEGYFTLIWATARYLIAWQREHWNGYSWMEPVDFYAQKRGKAKLRFKQLFEWKREGDESASAYAIQVVDWLLIIANVLIVVGGSLSSAAYNRNDLTPQERANRLDTSKYMRVAGQAVFVAVNAALLVCIIFTMRHHQQHRYDAGKPEPDNQLQPTRSDSDPFKEQAKPRPWFGQATLALLLCTWPFLTIRGSFGIAQALVPDLSYFNPEVYDENNLNTHFVAAEACLVIMTEFLSATLLASTYFTSRPARSPSRSMP